MVEFDIINHKGYIYLKAELQKILDTDKLKGIANARTLTLFPSDADLDEVEESLKIVLKDIRLRKSLKK